MDRDHFFIAVYCLVCEHYQALTRRYRIRHGGFAPALPHEEVITIEICGEFFKYSTDKDIFAYFVAHYRAFFPQLRERSLFARQAANLWRVKDLIQRLSWLQSPSDWVRRMKGAPCSRLSLGLQLDGVLRLGWSRPPAGWARQPHGDMLLIPPSPAL